MVSDDVIYALLLVISLPIGQVVKCVDNAGKRQTISSLVGLLMIFIVCGIDVLHSLFSSIINSLIICCFSPRVCHKLSFVWCFGYIVFFRTTHYFGLPQVAPHANAVQLLLTLKMVGLSFEVHDSWLLSEEDLHRGSQDADVQDKQDIKSSAHNKNIPRNPMNEQRRIAPSFLDMFMYYFCYIGIMTGSYCGVSYCLYYGGPYYKFKTYDDMIHDNATKRLSTYGSVKRRLVHVFPAIVVFLLVSQFYSIQYCRTDEFYEERSFIYRVWYMVPMFVIFRTRLYIAWIISECICMTATLGAYPRSSQPRCGTGPTDFSALQASIADRQTSSVSLTNAAVNQNNSNRVETDIDVDYSFETIHNIDVYGCELAPTVREGMRAWNQSVQYWLAAYVYKRLGFKSGPLRVAVTMIVSAFWHGVHAGYYLSFITIPINLVAEDVMIAKFRYRNAAVFDWFCWFCKMRSFDYMCMAFLLLDLSATVRYWRSIYFIGHIFIFLFIALGKVVRSRPRPSSDAMNRAEQTADDISPSHINAKTE